MVAPVKKNRKASSRAISRRRASASAPRPIGIGLLGSGFIARCHVYAYHAMPVAFPECGGQPVLELVCDVSEERAEAAARRFGFRRWTTDPSALIKDEAVDVVDICFPSQQHMRLATAAIKAGKHVYCEKPVGLDWHEARALAGLAAKARVKSLVGYNYIRIPLVGFAKRLIEAGAIGRPLSFRGCHNEDYLADPAHPFTWRCERRIAGRAGALGDLGGHIVSIARHLMGEVVAVTGEAKTVIAARPVAPGSKRTRPVENDDEARFLVRFAGGAGGMIETSRIAWGRKMDISFEITGTEGAIRFAGERMNQIELYQKGDSGDRQGFKTVLAGPDHPPYGNFIPAPGHGLGFNDLKVIEVAELMGLVAERRAAGPDFAEAAEISRVIAAVLRSSRERRWVRIDAV
ncbi:MAG: Gfo/Idh/MocA family oxidoreductase [Proteobacteria bacterium]|nr:Gfo/Idh/MocA family oxidoreductase [Pseudomonadota bacterium]